MVHFLYGLFNSFEVFCSGYLMFPIVFVYSPGLQERVYQSFIRFLSHLISISILIEGL